MTQVKFRICVLLLVFSLVLTVGTVMILRDSGDNITQQGSATLPGDTQSLQQSSATLPPVSQPQETTAVTTEPTAEPTTEEVTEETTEAPPEETTAPDATESEANTVGDMVAKLAKEQVGKPYRFGTAGPDSFDTSGLVQYCFKECGISVPRSNSALAEHGYIIDKENIRPGDAVFFWSSTPGTAEYLGIYVGEGIVVAALNESKPVVEFNMNSNYYTEHFVFVRRLY
jgi:cell wall-associated NlpC family hydrolase